LPADVAAVKRVQAQMHDFVSRAVSDVLTGRRTSGRLTPQQALQHVESVYEAAFEMLQVMADAEAET
jgi:hypothetical protein